MAGPLGRFVLEIAGKTGITAYPGHRFFEELVRTKAGTPKSRQLAAQMLMLFDKNKKQGDFCEIKRTAVDSYYLRNIDFDLASPTATDFRRVLTTAVELLGDGQRPTLVGHQCIHLVLLIRSLMDDGYVQSSWRTEFAKAFDEFTLRVKQARAAGDELNEYMRRYANKTNTQSDLAATIRDRHLFFGAKMLSWIQPTLRDNTRLFGPLDRELIYYRDRKNCQSPNCGEAVKAVKWADAEIHHVVPHAKGGATDLRNGALVHSKCHPKGDKAVQEFADHFRARRSRGGSTSTGH